MVGRPTVFEVSTHERQLVYLYVGSNDVGRDLGFYRDQLGGELVWRSELARLEAGGWTAGARRVEVPDGPCAVLVDPSGNELALLERVRPGVMEGRHG